jgi:RNA polymerase sigma factor (sigma-70 family)
MMDRSAFEDLYRENFSRVLAFALRRTARASADDVVATTFLIAWRRRNEIVGDPLPWLLGTARRVLANDFRTAKRLEALTRKMSIVEEASPQLGSEFEIGDSRIAKALASLHPRDRESLILTAWDELSPYEAARVVGCSSAAFRVRLHRARRRFTHALAEADADVHVCSSRGSLPAPEMKG